MRSLIKNKAGQQHLEVIISFAIFIGFLIFLFIIFNPFKAPSDPKISDTVFINLELAINCGIILSETISNCIKHAFSHKIIPSVNFG